MAEDRRKRLIKTALGQLARGGVAAIPMAGALLEPAIFGTLDKVQAAEEAERLNNALANIQTSTDSSTASLADLLEKANDQAALTESTNALLNDLVSALRDGEAAEPSAVLETSVEELFQHFGQKFEDVAEDIEAATSRLEAALGRIEPGQPDGPGAAPAAPTDRISLMLKLIDADQLELGSLVFALRASGYVTPNAPPRQKVNELLTWAAGGAGPGLEEVYRVARKIVSNFT